MQPRTALDSYYAGLGFDLTRLSLPFQLDVEYTSAFAGKNYPSNPDVRVTNPAALHSIDYTVNSVNPADVVDALETQLHTIIGDADAAHHLAKQIS